MLLGREADFLQMARRLIYQRPENPLRRLLGIAGCEYGDLVRLVGERGLEGALHELFRQGVYLTLEEFKRGRPVVRGSASFTMKASELLNPLNGRHLPIASGGSRGMPTRAHASGGRPYPFSIPSPADRVGVGPPWLHRLRPIDAGTAEVL
jgi:hypothetical protein